MKLLSELEVQDIMYGAGILGSGGGGDINDGLTLISKSFQKCEFLKVIDVNEIENDGFIASPYYIGSAKPFEERIPADLESYNLSKNPTVLATERLNKYLNGKLNYLCATELGGNTAWAIYTSMILDLPLVDGDPAGRAVPELSHTTFKLFEQSISPFALANPYGESFIVEEIINHDRAGIIAGNFAKASGNFAGICDHPMRGEKFKKSIIANTLTLAGQIGKAKRLVKDQERVIAEICKASAGKEIAQGVVVDVHSKKEDGLLKGFVKIKAENESIYTVYFINENMLVTKENVIVEVIPNIITLLDLTDFSTILNPDYDLNMKVAILSIPPNEVWLTEKGKELFGYSYLLDHTDFFLENGVDIKKANRVENNLLF